MSSAIRPLDFVFDAIVELSHRMPSPASHRPWISVQDIRQAGEPVGLSFAVVDAALTTWSDFEVVQLHMDGKRCRATEKMEGFGNFSTLYCDENEHGEGCGTEW